MSAPDTLPVPSGWYAVAFSRDLPRGGVQSVTFAGRELVLFRTDAGAPSLVDAYCPHLGAHLGKGGTVEGETIVCPFHGFRFDSKGTCVATAYGTKAPPKAKVRAWPLEEHSGTLLTYFDADDKTPTWSVPALDMTGWSSFYTHKFSLRGHPQETSENSVDLGHFSVVHRYSEVALTDLRLDGPLLVASYRFARRSGTQHLGFTLRAEFDAYVYGLGFSLVDVRLPQVGLRMRQLVLPTPSTEGHIDLRLAVSYQHPKAAGRLGAPLSKLIARGALPFVKNDVLQDFAIWKNKRYVHPPVLAEGDGPIMKYRTWASQFYPEAAAASTKPRPKPLPIAR